MGQENFRFYDNRQKYLLFITSCDEKWVVAERVRREINFLRPEPPALGVFDAGMGDGTLLSHVLRNLHTRFPTIPFHVVGKEISLEDVRMSLEKVPDRLVEHPQTVMAVTNLFYREAPGLNVESGDASAVNWHEVALEGETAGDIAQEIRKLAPILAEGWQVRPSRTASNLVYDRPSVIVLYRADQRFALDPIIPRRGEPVQPYDLMVVSQPYQARSSIDFKVGRILVPLLQSLGPHGRLMLIQSFGEDPGMEIIQGVWPDETPFTHRGHDLVAAMKERLGKDAGSFAFHADPKEDYLFRYTMHMLPGETVNSIGTSTLLAAWNAAIYVAQIDDQRLMDAIAHGQYLDATAGVLDRHGGLWFNDESFVVVRNETSVAVVEPSSGAEVDVRLTRV